MPENAFSIIGPGRVGLSLAHRLVDLGWRCVAVRGRSPAPSGLPLPDGAVLDSWSNPAGWEPPRLLVIAVPDRALGAAAAAAADALDLAGRSVLHTSGLHTSEALEPCRKRGAAVASWHPLLSFARVPLPGAEWTGAPCAIEGDPDAAGLGFRIARSAGLLPWTVPISEKGRYHAAAAVASNLPHICISAAFELLSGLGLPAGRGDSPLGPLVRSAVAAALEGRGLDTLTGAIARDDLETVARHLAELPPDLGEAYSALARWARSQRRAGVD